MAIVFHHKCDQFLSQENINRTPSESKIVERQSQSPKINEMKNGDGRNSRGGLSGHGADGNGNGKREHLQGSLQIHPMKLNGDCYKNYINSTYTHPYYHKVSQYVGSTQSLSKYCINYCKDRYHKTYKYAVLEEGGKCYCGAAEPYEELHSQCAMPCSGDHADYCGGPGDTATFYSLNNTDQRCLYGTEKSMDLHGLNETTIVADDNDASDRKHCWAKFTCPKGYKVQYYFHYFDTKYQATYPAIVYLYYNPMHEITQYTGSGSHKTRPVLFKWIDTEYHQLRFEFRTYYVKSNLRGFKMRLRCEIDKKL